MSKILSFAGLVFTFVMAYASDLLVDAFRKRAATTFTYTPYLWLAGVVNIFLAILLLLLTWYVVFRSDKSLFVSSMFVLIGLALTFAATLPPIYTQVAFTPNSHVLYVAAFVTVIGIAGFVLPRQLSI